MLGHVDMEGDYLLPQQLDLNQEHLCSFPNGPMTLPNFSELQSPSSRHDLKKEDGCPQNMTWPWLIEVQGYIWYDFQN